MFGNVKVGPDQMRLDYFYIDKEIDGESHNGLVKIGRAFDPLARRAQLQTGNPRKIITVTTILGGEKLESEFKRLFKVDKVDSGGQEWYKFTSEMLDWIILSIKQSLVTTKFRSDIDFGGPINIPKVELGEAKLPLIRMTDAISSVRLHEVVEASIPKSPYSKVGRK